MERVLAILVVSHLGEHGGEHLHFLFLGGVALGQRRHSIPRLVGVSSNHFSLALDECVSTGARVPHLVARLELEGAAAPLLMAHRASQRPSPSRRLGALRARGAGHHLELERASGERDRLLTQGHVQLVRTDLAHRVVDLVHLVRLAVCVQAAGHHAAEREADAGGVSTSLV